MIDAPCQLLFLQRNDDSLNIDLVTVEPLEREGHVLPPGTTVAIGISLDESSPSGSNVLNLLKRWADDSAIVRLGLSDRPEVLRLLIERGDQRVLLEAPGHAA